MTLLQIRQGMPKHSCIPFSARPLHGSMSYSLHFITIALALVGYGVDVACIRAAAGPDCGNRMLHAGLGRRLE